ncbi:ArsR/SmtB family transcription factor [Tessaracoccus antarcticus]|uniref:ArsR/SmtB family transcription factor n=1 Tax=Tessaracoccus antarcticus TaxID=2479848 RepID=UPI002D78BD07|nr:metalloregulator ArsR/SmtB family transcription factor [Tessaracoccus antarcticus]
MGTSPLVAQCTKRSNPRPFLPRRSCPCVVAPPDRDRHHPVLRRFQKDDALLLTNRFSIQCRKVAQLSRTFSALADPTRRAILAKPASGAATVQDIAAPFDMSMPAISQHLQVLETAGLISRGREAQWRPAR